MRRAPLVLAALTLAACGRSPSSAPSAPGQAAPPAAATPAVQKIYDTTCRTCHGVPASGAPQAGDQAAWAPRLAQGKDAVLGHVINGYQKMPPMGLCTQCSEDDFTALVEYMAGARLQ